jgi:iron complex outermembrane receptor protein
MTTITRTFFVLAGLAGILSITPAFAALDEMIVTSEHREADIQDVPIAVTAIGAQEMDSLQIFQTQDLQRYVPSLNMFNNITHPSNLSLSMRGGLQQDASLVVAESPIGMYIDDIYVGRMNSNNATMSDLERVEVLRGPQGTLYGRNTGYGAIRFLSRTPGEDKWANATIGAGNDEQQLLKGSVGGPLGESWAGSVAGQWRAKDEQYFNFADDVNQPTGLEENLTLRGKIRYMGSDTFDAVLTVAYTNSENDSNQMPNGTTPNVPSNCQDPSVVDTDPTSSTFGTCPAGVNTQFSQNDLLFVNGMRGVSTPWIQYDPQPPLRNKPQAETEQTIVGLTMSWDFTDNLTLKSITGYVGLDSNFMTDFTGTGGIIGGSESNGDQFTQEFQLLGSAVDDRLTYIAGFYYLDDEADQLWGWNANLGPGSGFANIGISEYTLDVETESMAVYGEASFNFTDALRLTAGLRYTDEDKKFLMNFQTLLGPVPPEIIPLDASPDAWTPRLVIEWTPTDSMMLYASYAEGFKGAGFSAIAIFNTGPVAKYDAETNETFEVGMKADWFDHRLRTNLAYYYSDIEDLQQNATVVDDNGNQSFPVQNSGDATIQGLEFEISAVPVEGLNLFLSGTAFTDGEFTTLQEGCGPPDEPEGCSAAAQAQWNYGVPAETPQTPDYSFNIGFDYTFDFRKQYLGAVTLGMDYYEIDSYITAATNEFRNEGWDTLNGYIAADITDNWRVKLSGSNLTDEDNITSGSRSLGGFVLLPPVEYLLQVTYSM